MSKCEFCGAEHDGSYGSGRFCSSTCARKYSNTFVTEEGRQNQISALNNNENREKAIANSVKTARSKPQNQYRNDLRPKFKHSLVLGKLGELEVSKKFVEHGYQVYTPLIDAGDGVDLLVSNENGFKTVQVKSTSVSDINENGECDNSYFHIHQLKREYNDGKYSYKKIKYPSETVNYIALYSAYDGESYLLENGNNIPETVTIRKEYPSSGQKKGVRIAKDYQIDNVLDRLNLSPGVYYDDENIIDCEYRELD